MSRRWGGAFLVFAAGCAASTVDAGQGPSLPGVGFIEIGRVDGGTAVAATPGGPAAFWVAQQSGTILSLAQTPARVVLDIHTRVSSGGETGLLGLAFAPKWPEDPRVFVNYTFKDSRQLRTRIASFRSVDGGATLDPASEVTLLEFDQPWSNHNSGPLQFGPDGMLYAAVGDGGSGGDPRGTGQDRSDFLGSILRLDVTTAPYRVPADNPFVAVSGVRPEIWAYGVRNPWGMHFDGATLWWADVGQDAWEEIDRGVPGGNYGWNRVEGTHCYEVSPCVGNFVAPVAEYGHGEGQSVTGGFVYRGPSIPALDGRYVYADFVMGTFYAVPAAGGKAVSLGRTSLHPSAFGRGREGSMVVVDYGGAVYRLVVGPG